MFNTSYLRNTQDDANSKRLRGVKLVRESLYAIGIFGMLTARQLARWCSSDSRSAYVVQLRVVHRLAKQGLILPRENQLGYRCYILTKKGAAALTEIKPEGKWHHGYDLGLVDIWLQQQTFERGLLEMRLGREVLARAGMRAYGIPNPNFADLVICAETENFEVHVRQASHGRRLAKRIPAHHGVIAHRHCTST